MATPDLCAAASLGILTSLSFYKPLLGVYLGAGNGPKPALGLSRKFLRHLTLESVESQVSWRSCPVGQCPGEVSVKMWLRAKLPSLYLPQLDICNSLIASCSPTSFLAAFLITYSFSASSFHRTLPHLPAPGGLQGAVGLPSPRVFAWSLVQWLFDFVLVNTEEAFDGLSYLHSPLTICKSCPGMVSACQLCRECQTVGKLS